MLPFPQNIGATVVAYLPAGTTIRILEHYYEVARTGKSPQASAPEPAISVLLALSANKTVSGRMAALLFFCLFLCTLSALFYYLLILISSR